MNTYLIFHSLAELVSVIIAWSTLAVAWNSRRHLKHSFFLVLGVAYAAAGLIDLLHMLAYKGMGVFPGFTADLPTQLWTAGRYLSAVSLLLAPWFLTRCCRLRWIVLPYAAVTAILIGLIFAGWFPSCFQEEAGGLTSFKIISEYLICGLIAGAMGLLWRQRAHLEKTVLRLLMASMTLAIATELSFTLYNDVYGIFNLIGHLLKIAAFVFLYQAVVVTGLRRPIEVLFSDLGRSEERYRNLVSASPDAILVQDNGHLLYANAAALELYGAPDFETLAARDIFQWTLSPEQKSAEDGHPAEPVHSFPVHQGQITHLDGHKTPVEARVSAVVYDGRIATQAILRDLSERMKTEQKLQQHSEEMRKSRAAALNLLQDAIIAREQTERAEQQLREINETLEQRVARRTAEVQDKAAQLRALAIQLSQTEQRERKRLAAILHDHLQQLIVAARMQLGWTRRQSDFNRIQATVQRVEGILKEALEASRSLTIDLSPPVLHEDGLVGALNWLADRILEKNQFKVHLRADSTAEPIDEQTQALLFECVRELLFNSVKHAGVPEAQVTLLRTKDNQVRMIVSDQGKGFDPHLLKKRRSNEATFGLFSIQERLAHIGGQMEIETSPGRGARIILTVPEGQPPSGGQIPETLPYKDQAETIKIRRKSDRCRILIVDDHKIMRDGLTRLLQFETDIEVLGEAADGQQAVELAEKLKPDVIIMDVSLGKISGTEATQQILAKNPHIKVIGLSTHTDTSVANAMRRAGAAEYLSKTGPSEDLLAAIRACLADPPDNPPPEEQELTSSK